MQWSRWVIRHRGWSRNSACLSICWLPLAAPEQNYNPQKKKKSHLCTFLVPGPEWGRGLGGRWPLHLITLLQKAVPNQGEELRTAMFPSFQSGHSPSPWLLLQVHPQKEHVLKRYSLSLYVKLKSKRTLRFPSSTLPSISQDKTEAQEIQVKSKPGAHWIFVHQPQLQGWKGHWTPPSWALYAAAGQLKMMKVEAPAPGIQLLSKRVGPGFAMCWPVHPAVSRKSTDQKEDHKAPFPYGGT